MTDPELQPPVDDFSADPVADVSVSQPLDDTFVDEVPYEPPAELIDPPEAPPVLDPLEPAPPMPPVDPAPTDLAPPTAPPVVDGPPPIDLTPPTDPPVVDGPPPVDLTPPTDPPVVDGPPPVDVPPAPEIDVDPSTAETLSVEDVVAPPLGPDTAPPVPDAPPLEQQPPVPGDVPPPPDPLGQLPDTPPPTVDRPPFEIHEDGTLVSQVPIADDVATVEDVTASEVYQQWQEARQAGDATAGDLAPDGAPGFGGDFASDTIIGDAGDVNFWFQQNSGFSCGPASATQIVNDFLDTGYTDENVLAQRALDLDIYDPTSGMTPQELERLLDDQGVPSTVAWYQDFDDVEQYLREGRAVVMFVDNRDISTSPAFAAGDELENSAADSVNHFVRVTGIDQARGVAVLADPGQANAAQLEVPLDQLLEAWNDVTHGDGTRGHMLVVSDQADATPDDVVFEPAPPAAQPTTSPTAQNPFGPLPQAPGPEPTGTPAPTGETPTTTGAPASPAATPAPTGETIPTGDPSTPASPGPDAPDDDPDATEPTGQDDPTPASGPMPTSEPAEPVPAPQPEPTPAVPAEPTQGTGNEVSLPASGPEVRVVPTSPRVVQPVEVQLPMNDGDLPTDDAAEPAEPADDVALPVESTSDDRDLFDPSVGWVIIPVAFAAGRVSAALRRK